MREEIEEKVIELIKEISQIEYDAGQLGYEDDITDFGINSFNYVKLVATLARLYGIKINTTDLKFDNFRTVKNITDYIQQKLLENSNI